TSRKKNGPTGTASAGSTPGGGGELLQAPTAKRRRPSRPAASRRDKVIARATAGLKRFSGLFTLSPGHLAVIYSPLVDNTPPGPCVPGRIAGPGGGRFAASVALPPGARCSTTAGRGRNAARGRAAVPPGRG